MTPAVTGPSVLKRYSTSPSLAPRTTKSPVSSPVKTTSPEVAVTAASIGRSEWYFHAIVPVDAFTALCQPRDSPIESNVKDPPIYCWPGVYRGSSAFLKTPHQSTVGATSISLVGLRAGELHSNPPRTPGQVWTPSTVGSVSALAIVVRVPRRSARDFPCR